MSSPTTIPAGRPKLLGRKDLWLLAGALLLAGVALALQLLQPAAVRIQAYQDGQLVYTGRLDRQAAIQLPGPYGTNTLCTGNGRAWISQADCPSGRCLSMQIVRRGQVIICAPHKLVVVSGETQEYDGLSG